jgi:REP-associated tyrosine transposase
MIITQHVIQRSRAACFSCADDRVEYLKWLCACSAECECAVHAYALMANHVHFLVTAANGSGGSDLGHALCERQQHYVSDRYGDRVARWDAGCEIRPVHARRYLLACMRYIELNPVRAGIVEQPADYRWSSYRSNALGHDDPLVTPHPLYYALGRSPETRRRAYAHFVHRGFAHPGSASP